MAVRVYLPDTWNFKTFVLEPTATFRDLRSMLGQKLKMETETSLGYSFYSTSDIRPPKIIDIHQLVVKFYNKEIGEDETFKIVFAPIGFHPSVPYAEFVRRQKDRVKAIEEIEKSKSQSQPRYFFFRRFWNESLTSPFFYAKVLKSATIFGPSSLAKQMLRY